MAVAFRLVVAASLCAALASCGGQRLDSSEIEVASRSITVPPSRAMVVPPLGGPAIVAVTQRSYDNAVAQEIALATRGATPGENAIYVAFFTSADVVESEGVKGNLLKMPSMQDDAILREMDERLPGVAMAHSAAFVQNKYGPFSYATGRGIGGETCLYAWQKLARGDSVFRPKSGAISIRIRLCDARASEAALLRVAYEFTIAATLSRSGWGPVDEAPSPSPKLGEAGAPIYPFGRPDFEAAPRGRPAATRSRPARTPSGPSRPESAEPDLPARRLEGYPVVPPPPPTGP